VRADRILLVRLSALGDVLQCLPALAALRAARPDAEIAWVVERRFADLLDGHPHLDRVFVFERKKGGGWFGNLRALLRLRREVRAWAPDRAVDLQGNLKAALVAWLSGAKERVGLPATEAREGAHRFATTCPSPATDPREHRAERALRLVNGTAGNAETPAIPDAARERVGAALGELARRRFALLLPGTSEFGAFKRWPTERFGALAARLRAECGLPSLVAFGPGQRGLAEAVVATSQETAALAPETANLQELGALVAAASLVVGPDSGPVILAAAAGTPTVALFGPKDPAVYAPRGPRTTVVWKKVYCSPCTLRRCGDPICMTTMEVDEVLDGVRRVLDTAEVRT
jgi:lipopolysaccharide heptosyltransferase I